MLKEMYNNIKEGRQVQVHTHTHTHSVQRGRAVIGDQAPEAKVHRWGWRLFPPRVKSAGL